MEDEKIYLQPKCAVLNAICDIVELQKGRLTFSDTPHGLIHFSVRMYAFAWEIRFRVTDIGLNRCVVRIDIGGEARGRENMIFREFALLDSMLLIGAKIEIAKQERGVPDKDACGCSSTGSA